MIFNNIDFNMSLSDFKEYYMQIFGSDIDNLVTSHILFIINIAAEMKKNQIIYNIINTRQKEHAKKYIEILKNIIKEQIHIIKMKNTNNVNNNVNNNIDKFSDKKSTESENSEDLSET